MEIAMSLGEIVQRYKNWSEREKWLLLRKVAYEHLRDRFFASPKSIDGISYSDFAKYYLGFCTIGVGGLEHKLTVSTISSFLEKYSISYLENLMSKREIKVVGNASWSQLHMGTKKEKWDEIKRAMKFLLFGNDETPISNIEENEVLDRLRVVMEGSLSTDGFSRAKITPLLLICDSRNRFGVWNSISDKALYQMKLKPKGGLTSSRLVAHYVLVNEGLRRLKNDYAFMNFSDVDIFVWYYLDQVASYSSPESPTANRQPASEQHLSHEVKTNPLIRTATFSLMNALEFFQRGEERHRQGALILMDQAAEYFLKAKLYQIDHVKFIADQLERLDFEQVMQEVDKHKKLLDEDKFHLRKVHSVRNYAQHRAVIPDSSWTREYMEWIYNFIRRFSYDNFGVNIDSMIPSDFRNGL
jgi:hypothetical protein